jgi:hypothetical protein
MSAKAQIGSEHPSQPNVNERVVASTSEIGKSHLWTIRNKVSLNEKLE